MCPPPCLYDIVMQSYDQCKIPMCITIVGKTCVQMLFHGPSLTIVSQWGNFGALLPPRGTTYTPLRGMFSYSLIASSSVVIHKFLRNSRSELRPAKVGPMHCQWDFLGDFSPPGRLSYSRSLRKDIAHHSSISRTI